jgi:tRNA(adenine34) deaminase
MRSADPSATDWIADAMGAALAQARTAPAHGDVPVGAVVVQRASGEVVAGAHNERELRKDPTAHAEVLALQATAHLHRSWRLDSYALVVTLEPCPMCAGAIWAARLPLVVYGAPDPKAGAAGSLYNFAADPRLNHSTEVIGGVRAQECAAILSAFFADKR